MISYSLVPVNAHLSGLRIGWVSARNLPQCPQDLIEADSVGEIRLLLNRTSAPSHRWRSAHYGINDNSIFFPFIALFHSKQFLDLRPPSLA